MWELDHKKGWAPKNWCFQTVVLENMLESLLDNKEIKPVNPKGNQHWIFIGRTDVEAEVPILWPPDEKSWLTGKDSDAVKDCEQEEKGMHIVYTYIYCCCSVAKSCLTLWLHEIQHSRLPCPSLSPIVCLNSSIELAFPSNHLIIFCHPLLLLPSIFPSIRLFPNELVLCIRWPKY